jgi:hypothetical protein
LKRENEVKGREKSNGEIRKLDSAIDELKLNSIESGGKIIIEKKVIVRRENNMKKLKINNLIYMQERVRLNLFFMLTSQ